MCDYLLLSTIFCFLYTPLVYIFMFTKACSFLLLSLLLPLLKKFEDYFTSCRLAFTPNSGQTLLSQNKCNFVRQLR